MRRLAALLVSSALAFAGEPVAYQEGTTKLAGYLARPTPRAANAATGDGFAPDLRAG